MADPHCLYQYTREVLAHQLGTPPAVCPIQPPEQAEALARRVATAYRRSGQSGLVLMGLASGAVFHHLTHLLPSSIPLVGLEPNPEVVRGLLTSGRLSPLPPQGSAQILSDTSPLALLLLLRQAGLLPGAMLLANPELSPGAKRSLAPLATVLATPSLPLPPPGPLNLSVAAILSPEEPALPEFLSHIPAWVEEVVCVWDSSLPSLPSDPRRRDLVRPLEGNFAAQRNAALAACRGEWVLMMDADERLPPPLWDALPRLAAVAGVAGYHLPRLTLYPDAHQAMVGYGLWPDVQLRFFRRTPGLRFVRPIHERLEGVDGAQALVPEARLLHLQRLLKGQAALRAKLEGFDAAGGPPQGHVLSATYPHLPLKELPGDDAIISEYLVISYC